MPDGNDIYIVSFARPAVWQEVDKNNRNVFRLDKNAKVIWQITRIDHPGRNWAAAHQQARERGDPGCIEPFIYPRLRLPDGTTNLDNGMPPDSMDYIPGCPVELANLGLGSQWYLLDVDTGIAVEITPTGFRPW